MARTGNKNQSLRTSTFAGDPKASARDTGEALKDLQRASSAMTQIQVIAMDRFAYAPPFFLEVKTQPKAIVVARCQISGSFDISLCGAITAWRWNGNRLRIGGIYAAVSGSSAAELVSGTLYDLSFLVVG